MYYLLTCIITELKISTEKKSDDCINIYDITIIIK